jgi:phenylacetate-CoA ligase
MDSNTRLKVRSINVFGEFLTDTTISMLSEFFPNGTVRSLFAVSEIGAVSTVSCDHQPLNFYHPRPGIEVAVYEPDEVGVGELLVSTLLNQTIPIERYKTGDSVRIHTGECQCGQTTTFEVLGRRGYDYLKIAGVTLRQEETERVAHALHAFDDYRVEASSVREGEHMKGKIVLHVFRKDGVSSEELAREIGTKFARELRLTPTRTLADLVEQKIFVPIEVVFKDMPFPDANKNIKLIESV